MHSRRIDPIKRSTYPFCQGERNDVGRSRMPIALMRALVKVISSTRIKPTIQAAAFEQHDQKRDEREHGHASACWCGVRANPRAIQRHLHGGRNLCRRILIKTALRDARVPSAANKLDNFGSTGGIQNRRTKVAPTWNAACAGAIFWRQIFWWQQRGRLSGQ